MIKIKNIKEGYSLQETCSACPERYDMLDCNGNTVGYFRLRHGRFCVYYPDFGGKLVYYAEPEGDGCFEENERDYYLEQGIKAVIEEMKRTNNVN